MDDEELEQFTASANERAQVEDLSGRQGASACITGDSGTSMRWSLLRRTVVTARVNPPIHHGLALHRIATEGLSHALHITYGVLVWDEIDTAHPILCRGFLSSHFSHFVGLWSGCG